MNHSDNEHVGLSPEDNRVLIYVIKKQRLIANICARMTDPRKTLAFQYPCKDSFFHHIGNSYASLTVQPAAQLLQVAHSLGT